MINFITSLNPFSLSRLEGQLSATSKIYGAKKLTSVNKENALKTCELRTEEEVRNELENVAENNSNTKTTALCIAGFAYVLTNLIR